MPRFGWEVEMNRDITWLSISVFILGVGLFFASMSIMNNTDRIEKLEAQHGKH